MLHSFPMLPAWTFARSLSLSMSVCVVVFGRSFGWSDDLYVWERNLYTLVHLKRANSSYTSIQPAFLHTILGLHRILIHSHTNFGRVTSLSIISTYNSGITTRISGSCMDQIMQIKSQSFCIFTVFLFYFSLKKQTSMYDYERRLINAFVWMKRI